MATYSGEEFKGKSSGSSQNQNSLLHTCKGSNCRLLQPLQPTRKQRYLPDDILGVKVSCDSWSTTKNREGKQNSATESSCPLVSTRQVLPPLQLPEAYQSLLNDSSEVPDISSSLLTRDDLAISGSTLPAQARGCQNENNVATTTITDDSEESIKTSTFPVQEDNGSMTGLNFESKDGLKTTGQESNLDNRRVHGTMKEDSDHETKPAEYLSRQWKPDSPSDQEQYSEFREAESVRRNPINISGYTLPHILQASNTEDNHSESLDLYQAATEGNFDKLISINETVEHSLNEIYSSAIQLPLPHRESSFGDQPFFDYEFGEQETYDPMDIDSNSGYRRGASPGLEIRVNRRARAHTWSSMSSIDSSALNSDANDYSAVKMSNEDFIAACRSCVAEKFRSPSLQASSTPEHEPAGPDQIAEDAVICLDQRVSQQGKSVELDSQEGAKALEYDPLGDTLTLEQEKHEAARCLDGAILIFQQDPTGRKDWYDHDIIQLHENISTLGTDKWHDDFAFLMPGDEFEILVENLDIDKNESIQPPEQNINKFSENLTMKDMSNACNTSIHYETAEQTQYFTPKDKMPEQDIPLSPAGDPNCKIMRLETTPKVRSHVTKHNSSKSEASFMTAQGSHEPRGSNFDDEASNARDSRNMAPSSPEQTVPSQSKSKKAKSGTKEKTTKNIFAAVQRRNGQLGGRGLNFPIPGREWSWGGGPSRPRPIQPSPMARNSTPSYQVLAPNIVGGSFPMPTAGQGSGPRPSFVTAPEHHQNFHHQSIIPTTGSAMPLSFVPNSHLYGSQPQQFPGNIPMNPAVAQTHFNAWDNRGQGGQMGFPHPQYHGGRSYSASSTANNPMQHAQTPAANVQMQHGRMSAPYMPLNHSQRPIGHIPMQYGQISPGNQSVGSPVSPASQLFGSGNSPQYSLGQGHQDESPTANRMLRKNSYATGQTPNPQVNPQLETQAPLLRPRPDFSSRKPSESTPIKSKLPQLAPKYTSREKAVIIFRGHKECAKALQTLQDAAQSSPDLNISFAENLEQNPTTITISAPAGKMIRGWVKKLVPHAHIEMSMI
jgi:hypothetical protein